jgi:hypothetical protein
MKNNQAKVQIFHRRNKLKLKAGTESEAPGFIDPAAIQRAQATIDEKEKHSRDEMGESLARLNAAWQEALKKSNAGEARQEIDRLYNYANNIKDLAETYDYYLMTHFSESLRDFCEKIDIRNEAHHTIVQAHIDVMQISWHDNIKDEDGLKAAELKDIVARAIDKYS